MYRLTDPLGHLQGYGGEGVAAQENRRPSQWRTGEEKYTLPPPPRKRHEALTTLKDDQAVSTSPEMTSLKTELASTKEQLARQLKEIQGH